MWSNGLGLPELKGCLLKFILEDPDKMGRIFKATFQGDLVDWALFIFEFVQGQIQFTSL